MTFVRALSEEERRALRKGVRREVGRVSERMRAVLLSARQFSVADIARIFECDESTVREWIARFETGGVQGLHDLPRSGRRPRATPAARERVRRAVKDGPASVGYGGTAAGGTAAGGTAAGGTAAGGTAAGGTAAGGTAAGGTAAGGVWTVVTLKLYLFVSEQLKVSDATVRRLLIALDFRWRRPKLVLPTDPEARQKMWTICECLLAAPAHAVVLCLDECDVHLLPVLRAMWMHRGQQARVMTPGQNRKRGVFGALDPETGTWHYSITERKRTVEFLTFLEQLLQAYPTEPLLLVLDNASIHRAKLAREWLIIHPTVAFCFLPTYAGHRENPVEKVWWRMKQQVAANRLYGDLDALTSAVHQFFGALTPSAALQLAA